MEEGNTFMTAWRKEEERETELYQNRREAEEADKTLIVPGVTTEPLRRFKAALMSHFKVLQNGTSYFVDRQAFPQLLMLYEVIVYCLYVPYA